MLLVFAHLWFLCPPAVHEAPATELPRVDAPHRRPVGLFVSKGGSRPSPERRAEIKDFLGPLAPPHRKEGSAL